MQVDSAASTSAQPAGAPAQTQEEIALGVFARATLDVMTLWPARRVAVANGEGFPDSLDALAMQVVDAFNEAAQQATPAGQAVPQGQTSTHHNGIRLPGFDDLQATLKFAFDQEFDVDLEDGSEYQLAKDLIALWRECLDCVAAKSEQEGPMAVKFREQAEKVARAEAPQRFERQGGDDSSDDSEDFETEDEEMEAPALVDASGSSSAPQRLEPIVDEDGFETVQSKKKGGRR
ncbi:hypothetical protein JCM10213_003725 [Rhodosporidiobolus nylandii]